MILNFFCNKLTFSIKKCQTWVRFYEKEEGEKVDERIVVAIHSRKGVKEYVEKLKIKLIEGIKGIESAIDYLK